MSSVFAKAVQRVAGMLFPAGRQGKLLNKLKKIESSILNMRKVIHFAEQREVDLILTSSDSKSPRYSTNVQETSEQRYYKRAAFLYNVAVHFVYPL